MVWAMTWSKILDNLKEVPPQKIRGDKHNPILGAIHLFLIRKKFVVSSPNFSGASNGGTEPYKAILGVGFPLHKPYILLI